MATDVITRRVIELEVRTTPATEKAIKDTAASMGNLEKGMKSASDAVKQFAIGFASAFTVGAAVSALKSVVAEMDNAVDAAQSLGMSVSDLTAWNHAAEMSSASAEDLAIGVKGLSKDLANMGDETKQSTKQLKAFGVDARDSVDAALTKIAEGFSKMEDGPKKSALAMDIFGKAGMKLIPLLNSGAEGIEELKKQAHDLGIVFSDEAAKAANQLGDQMDVIQKQVKGTTIEIATGLIPALTALAGLFTTTSESAGGFKVIGESVGTILIWVTKILIGFTATVEAAAIAFGAFVGYLNTLSTGNARGALEGLKGAWEDIDAVLLKAGERMNTLDEGFQKAKEAMRPIQGPPAPPKTGGGGGGKDDGKKAKVDQDVQALERYIKASREAAMAANEFSNVQRLEYEVTSGAIKVVTAKEKALYGEAMAAAKMADLRKRQVEEEKKDIAAGKEARDLRDEEIKQFDLMVERFRDMGDPTRAIRREMELLDKAIASTTDGQVLEQLNKAANILQGQFITAMTGAKGLVEETTDSLADLGKAMAHEIEGYSKDAANAIVEFATTGKSSVKEMVTSILSDLAKLAVKRALDPLFKDFGAFIEGFAETGPVRLAAQGGVFGRSGVQAFASGGVVSSPTFFGMAGGGAGLMGEAGPEAVVPLRRTSGGDLGVQASPVNVTVVNNNGSQIKTEETKGAMGEREILIMVNNAVEEGLGRGRFDRVMSTTYGVSRRGR